MRVVTNPGTVWEKELELRDVMVPYDVFKNGDPVRTPLGALVEILVEKGVLTLADCRALGAPHMESVD